MSGDKSSKTFSILLIKHLNKTKIQISKKTAKKKTAESIKVKQKERQNKRTTLNSLALQM